MEDTDLHLSVCF